MDKTRVYEDYLYNLNDEGILVYEELGDEGFKPIVMCSVKTETTEYLKQLIIEIEIKNSEAEQEIEKLNKRITVILTFDPQKLSSEIKSTENIILKTKDQWSSKTKLQPLVPQLDQIEMHFKSLSKVAYYYEEVYKNIILPVKEEGRLGVR